VELAASAQSVRLTMQQMDLLVESGQLPWAPGTSADLLDTVVTSHLAVIGAIESRDAGAARDLTQEHVDTRTRWLVERRLRPAAGPAAARAATRQDVGA
jgi:DNA-binding GntR family transcriptional regulator